MGRARLAAIVGAALLAAGAAHPGPARAQAAATEADYPTSQAEYDALKAKAKGGTQHSYATMPDWTGVWKRVLEPGGGYGGKVPLTPKYQAAYDKKMAKIKNGIEWDRLSYCLPVGMPRWLSSVFLREYIVTPKETWLIHEQMQEIRRIYTDGRGHVPDSAAIPLWQGDSIGFWDGDTLVIHTTHMKAGEYGRGQPDYSFKVSSVERMRKVGPNLLEARITVYDPDSLTRPFKAVFRYEKQADPDLRVNYNSCEEGNNVVRTPEGGGTFILPGEPGYHDPATFGIPEVALDSLPQ